MKKINFLFVLALLFGMGLVADNAYALNCKTGQSGNSDECWTDVKVSALETNVVSAGAVLVYDKNTGDPDRGAYEVVLATASADRHRIAGIAQQRIATGDWGRVLVRGQGQLFTRAAASSGDLAYVSTSEGKSGHLPGVASGNTASADPIGWFLESSTGDEAVDAYINVLS